MSSNHALRLVPDELWAIVEPLIPEFTPRRQGGGTAPVEDRAVFTAIVYVLTSGCAWRHQPGEFGVKVPTAQLHDELAESTVASVFASFSTIINVAVRARKIPASPAPGHPRHHRAGRARAGVHRVC
ncbi:transposase [Actinomadura sp. 3N508]|uniref:transposase n=1 Tax=Actinomadura sp. 3N508 TaxID=3375153 RepID=UPI00378BD204